MKNKVCSCCKNEIIANSIKAIDLYVICLEWYDYHKGLDRDDYNFYIKCRECNSLIKITTEEANEILNNCGYKCEYYSYPLNFSETGWKDDYPNNFKRDDYHSGFNPNSIFKIKVEINLSADIISKLDDASECLNDILKILDDNKADKKCQNVYDELRHILYDFEPFKRHVNEIVEENLKNIVDTKEIVENKWYRISKRE